MDMDWTSDLKEIIDSFETSQDLEEFSVLWDMESDPYIQQRLIELKWQELQNEMDLQPVGLFQNSTPKQNGGATEPIGFTISKVSEKQFKKSRAIDRHYKVQIDQNALQGKKVNELHNELHDLFDRALAEVKQNMQGNDLGRVVIHHPSLNHEIVVPLQQLDQLDANTVMETVENVLSSNENVPMDSDFNISVGTIEVPKGAGKRKHVTDIQSTNNSLMKKHSIGYINNPNDKLCLQRSIAYAWAKINQVDRREWHELTSETPDDTILVNILRHKKVPSHYYSNIKAHNRKEQLHLAVALSNLAGVSTERPSSIQDIEQFELALDISVAVISSKCGNKFIRVPRNTDKNQRIYLYLVENDDEQHWYPILSPSGFFSTSYFCETCFVPYSTKGKHVCTSTCLICKHDNCLKTDQELSCKKCHMTCRSLECFLRHQTSKTITKNNKKIKLLSECEKYWKCTDCKKVLRLESGDEKRDHKCGDYKCPSCSTIVQPGHLCYQRAIKSNENKRKFIFFDIETTQNTKVSICMNGEHTDSCLCDKYEHVPNLIVAQKACESCMNHEMDNEAKCKKCGSICKRCSDLHATGGKPVFNCKDCYLRQHIFYGDTTCFDFCQWLFTQGNSDTTVISHNGRGFDHFPILKYLVDQSIVPQTIFTGSKCMYMHIARSLNIRFVDSLSFLPMKLADLPSCFGLDELKFKKGYWPHYFNTKENENYVGVYPSAEYYGYNSMSARDRQTFLEWHSEQTRKGNIFNFKKELIEYCISDVDILRQACLSFWMLMKSCTGEYEEQFNPKKMCMEQKLMRYVIHLKNVTIAENVCKNI
ncbi:uncharacterized protein LOC128549269 [Mercenaria mercenaria]|uniref:uncharacterized protein LOC128549269 n=1 Tax=Mercenaria mercenaria TaxID=6596 RepID=UPI00234EA764|nr:uncharacterized protein LOC128549269 [Mercenaria mercenaria]